MESEECTFCQIARGILPASVVYEDAETLAFVVTRAVGRAFPHEGLSLWHSVGPAAFQEVPHLHFHIHPRFHGDNFLRVYPGELPTSDQATREHYAEKVRAQLEAD